MRQTQYMAVSGAQSGLNVVLPVALTHLFISRISKNLSNSGLEFWYICCFQDDPGSISKLSPDLTISILADQHTSALPDENNLWEKRLIVGASPFVLRFSISPMSMNYKKARLLAEIIWENLKYDPNIENNQGSNSCLL